MPRLRIAGPGVSIPTSRSSTTARSARARSRCSRPSARWRDRMEAEPVRFLGRSLQVAARRRARRRSAVPRRGPGGLAFVPNATTGVSTVLDSLRFEPGDELLTTDHEYNATLNALRTVARRDGAPSRRSPASRSRSAARTRSSRRSSTAVTPRTRLALISHVTSPTALVLPIDRDRPRARPARGVDTLVDAAHAPGMVQRRRRRRSAPAYWTGNGHKWLCGPKGSAVLWVRADRRDRDPPAGRVARRERAAAGRPGSRFRLEFDWTGHGRPDGRTLALADAIDWIGGRSDAGRLAGDHGREPRPGDRRPGRRWRRRSGSSRRRPDSMTRLDGGAAAPRTASTMTPPTRSIGRSSRTMGSRSRSRLAGRGRPVRPAPNRPRA